MSVIHGAAFSPHAPDRLALHGVKGKTECGQRLSSPKPLPVHRPVGPLLPGIAVNWEKWNLDDLLGGNLDEGDMSKVCETWFAGAECELASALGVSGTDEEACYLGLGEDPRIVKYRGRGRFRDVSSDLGIIGQRLNWIAKSLHLVLIHSSSIAVGNDLDGARADVLMRIGHRAWALSREKWSASVEVDGECRALVRRSLSFLTSIVRTSHGAPPLVARWALGDAEAGSSPRAALAKEVAASHQKLCDKRRGRALKEARAWARRASAAELHRATKPPDQHGRKSASAEKDHRGERTDYEAAVHGAHEWQPLWMATAVDTSDDIMSALEALGKVHPLFPSIRLPPFDPDRIAKRARRFKGNTGRGTDGARPWHIALLTYHARRILAAILTAIERKGRWPSALRWVASVALSKKAGGARLIGISGAIYRLWARLRYDDCRDVLEARLDRPWFAAAPGKGAERAALEVSLAAEAASARDLHTASSAVDLKKFYEHITATDFAIGAIQVGIPLPIILLTSHLYTGPRLLRVRQAVADPLFPRRSVVAGCTWATVHVRVMMLLPLDRFQERIKAMAKQWDVQVRLTMYIDDGFAITTGSVDAVAFVHIWLSRMVIAFMEAVLKKPVAKEKLQCTASSAPLRASLHKQLSGDGFKVGADGEVLGIDFAPGKKGAALRQAAGPIHQIRQAQAQAGVAAETWRGRQGGGQTGSQSQRHVWHLQHGTQTAQDASTQASAGSRHAGEVRRLLPHRASGGGRRQAQRH